MLENNLRKIRLSQNLSLRELSALCGVNKNQLQKIELGEVSPRVDTLFKIAKALNVTLNDIFTF